MSIRAARDRHGPMNFVSGQPGTTPCRVMPCKPTGCTSGPTPSPRAAFVPGPTRVHGRLATRTRPQKRRGWGGECSTTVVEERRLLGSRRSAEQKPLGIAQAPARPCHVTSAASSGRPTAIAPRSGPRGRPRGAAGSESGRTREAARRARGGRRSREWRGEPEGNGEDWSTDGGRRDCASASSPADGLAADLRGQGCSEGERQ
jgi:hypothetical protein